MVKKSFSSHIELITLTCSICQKYNLHENIKKNKDENSL